MREAYRISVGADGAMREAYRISGGGFSTNVYPGDLVKFSATTNYYFEVAASKPPTVVGFKLVPLWPVDNQDHLLFAQARSLVLHERKQRDVIPPAGTTLPWGVRTFYKDYTTAIWKVLNGKGSIEDWHHEKLLAASLDFRAALKKYWEEKGGC